MHVRAFPQGLLGSTKGYIQVEEVHHKNINLMPTRNVERLHNTLITSELVIFPGKYKSNVLTTYIFITVLHYSITMLRYSHLHSFLHGAGQLVVFPHLR